MRKLTIVLLLLLTAPLHAQQPATRYGVEAGIGTMAGLGYKLPSTRFGGWGERSIGDRVELQARAYYSPDKKFITNDGNSVVVAADALYWVKRRLALDAGDRESWLWTSEFNKKANVPNAGLAVRFWWLGVPSRLYVRYVMPTGARPSNGSLQSSRLQGGELTYEGQIYPRARLGLNFAYVTFLEQGTPGRRDYEGTVMMYLRWGTRQAEKALY